MSDIKPIRTRQDYEDALVLLGDLISQNPELDTPESAKIDILTTLIENYENAILPDYESDPIEAIKLRVEQLGLKDVDLVPFLGSRSRVSEILAGKRPLTVPMIKNLEEGLGIPATILVGSNQEKKTKRWSPATLTLMAQRGYFGEENRSLSPKQIREGGFIRSLFAKSPQPAPALLRQSNYRDISKIDHYHMEAWANKVINDTKNDILSEKIANFDIANFDEQAMATLFKLSAKPTGVLEVIEKLKEFGIVVDVEPQLPSTRLDGATFFVDGNPIIGLTLRYDRLDSFWFTLAHELAHIFLHSDKGYDAFYDQLFEPGDEKSSVEKEADHLAGELLIPSEKWNLSPLRYASTPTLVRAFAKEMGVHESIVAGRIRHDSQNWTVHSDIVNNQEVRSFFKDKLW